MNTSCSDTVKCRLDAGKSPIFRSQNPCTYIYIYTVYIYIYVQEAQRFWDFVRIYTYERVKLRLAITHRQHEYEFHPNEKMPAFRPRSESSKVTKLITRKRGRRECQEHRGSEMWIGVVECTRAVYTRRLWRGITADVPRGAETSLERRPRKM